MNKFIGVLRAKETMKVEGTWEIQGFANKTEKHNLRTLKYYRNKNVITCVIKTNGIKAIGIAKCNPKDEFNYSDGIIIAELRARENLYKIAAEKHIRRIKERSINNV